MNFALGIEEVTPEKREYAQREFPGTGILDFALGIDEVTTKKRFYGFVALPTLGVGNKNKSWGT